MIVINKPFYKKIDINFIGNTKSYIKKSVIHFYKNYKKIIKRKNLLLNFSFFLGKKKLNQIHTKKDGNFMGTFSFCIKARGSKFLFYICLIGLKRLPQLSKRK